MNVVEFLSSLAKKDIRLWLEGENLRFSAPEGVFTADLRSEVVKRKPDIINFLKQAQRLKDQPVPRADRNQPLALSFGQRRLWILAQLNPQDVTYNMASALALRGRVDPVVLERTFATIVQRHDSLRTRFVEQEGATVQVIDPFTGWRLDVEDVSALDTDARERVVQEALDREVLTPYDLGQGPLLRVRLLKRGNEDFVLIVGMHHIISDGMSMEVLVKELVTLYMTHAAGLPSPLPELPVQYADFAAWQHQWMASDGLQKQLDYWHDTLRGAPPVLALPTDRRRQANPRNHGAVYQHDIRQDLTADINAFCQRHELTPFMLFLGTWQLLLGRYAHTEDVIVGSPIAGRSRAEFEDIIGFFVNLLLMRGDLSGNPTVTEYFARVRTQALGAFSHQDVPIDYLLETLKVERQPGYPPVAQVAFQLINVGSNDAAANGPVSVEPIPLKHVAARMDMLLAVARHDDRYSLSIEYNTDLFNASTLATLAGQYEYLLSQIIAGENRRLAELTLVSRDALIAHLGLEQQNVQLMPLNGNQRSMLMDELANAGTHQNNYGIFCELPFALDVQRMQDAINTSLARHPMLRARILSATLHGTDDAWLVIPKTANVTLQVHTLPAGNTDWRASVESLIHRAQPVIDTPLVHCHAVRVSADHWVLVLGCHHIALDGASTFLWMQDVLAAYAGVNLPAVDHAAAVQTYNDHDGVLCDSPDVTTFWRGVLQDIEPLDFSKPVAAFKAQPVSQFNDRRHELQLQGDRLVALRDWCRSRRISPAMFCKAVYGLMLSQYCRTEEDFAFFEFQGNRQGSLSDAIGCIYQQSPVVLRKSAWQKDATLGTAFTQLAALRDAAKPWRRFSLAAQNARVPRARAVFMYNYYNFVLDAHIDGHRLQPVISAPKVDKGVQFIVREEPSALTLELRYDVDVFDDIDFLERFLSVANQIVGGVERIADLSFLLADEQRWLDEQNATALALPPHASIVSWFDAGVAANPDALAIVHGKRSLTHLQLQQSANRLAHHLANNGIGKGRRVALCLDRSIELLVAVWGVLKSGASYVPVDPAYPRDRIDHILKDADASLLITASSLRDRLPQSTCEVLALDEISLQALPSTSPATAPAGDDEIYVIYTSGSTGLPKGAAVTHTGEVNLQLWYLSSMQLSAQDRPVLVSAVGFDLTQKNLFAPLLAGGAIVLPEMDFYDDEAILDAVREHRATWINCAPSAFYPLVEADRSHHYARLASLRYVVLGGEPIRLSALYDWLSSPACRARIMNSYGPTECTDVVAWHVLEQVDEATTLIPIGKPVPNMHLHVLNDALQPVAPGLVGEICVSGIGVGLGYLNRPELNQSVFLANPFGAGRLYRTGDLGRYLPDGNLEYLGRKDFQIKLRGLRIELGEIEAALKALGPVRDALVLVRNEQLVAYVLSEGAAAPDQWREQLRAHLPEYMVPAALVALDAWPLTPNGKIDRKALPEPSASTGAAAERVAPRTDIEQEIAAIWAECLGKDSVGVLDNLFELGGNSITATRIASRLRKLYEAPVSVRDVFRAGNVAELAVIVERAQLTENLPPLLAQPRDGQLPLSYAQQRLWMLDQFDPGLPAYNMPGAFRLVGELDAGALVQALCHIVDRHEILRSHVSVEDDTPWLTIAPAGQWQPERLDLGHWSGEDREAEIRRRVTNELGHRFNLHQGRLIRAQLIRCSDREHVLITNMHHMVSDGWSNGIFVHELSQGYDAFSHGTTPALAALPVQYADYAAWQRAWLTDAELEKQLTHWRQVLTGVPALRLPVDHPRRLAAGSPGASIAFAIPAREYQTLLQLSRTQGVTLYAVLLSAWMVLLARHANQRDISVGTPVANRNNDVIEGLIGFFVNTLVVRGNLATAASFTDLVQQVGRQAMAAQAHQDVPFERLVDALVEKRDLYRSPLFQTMFALQNVPMEQNIALGGVAVEPLDVQAAQAKFELSLSLLEWQGELRGELEYRTDLFAPQTARYLVDAFVALVEQVCTYPETTVHSLLSVARPGTGWTFVPASVAWEQEATDTLSTDHVQVAEQLQAAVSTGTHSVLILAEDDAPAAPHEIGEILVLAGTLDLPPSMRTLSLFDCDWISTGLYGHCNVDMQLVLSCVGAVATTGDWMPVDEVESTGSALERQISEIWREVLGVPRVNPGDDFFRLGGHSLLATRVISRVRKALGISVPVRTLFEHSRLHAFVDAIAGLKDASGDAAMPALEPVARGDKLPLSFTQQQLWLLDQLDPGNPAYNMPFALKIEGELHITAFNQAFTTIIERHEALRCNFPEQDGLPYVVVQAPRAWKFETLDLSGNDLQSNLQRLPDLSRTACESRFDITRDLLIRGQLVILGSDGQGVPHYAILGAIHHMVSDGWSLNLITRELAVLYKAYREKTAALLPPLPIQYVDFAHWQRQWLQGEELERQVAYWRGKLDNEYQVLDLPTDYPRPAIATSNGASLNVSVPAELKQQIDRIAAEHNATPFMVMLTALYVALHRYSGQAGINVGTPIAGRNQAETEALVGFFINTVIMAVELGDNPALTTLLQRVRNTALEAYAHQSLPFEKIVEVIKPRRDPSRAPLFQVFFNLLNLPDPTEVSGIKVDNLAQEDNEGHAKYDINIYAKEFSDRIDLHVVYNPDLYKRESIGYLMDAMVAALRHLADSPATRVLEMPLFEAGQGAVDPAETIEERTCFNPLARLQHWAVELPERIAITDTVQRLTYRALDAAVTALAQQIAAAGVGEGDVVMVYAPRSAALPLALLATLKAGACFSVLDPAYPLERLQKCIALAQPVLLLADQSLPLPEPLQQAPVVTMDIAALSAMTSDKSGQVALPAYDPDRRAYLAFTSGTTGEPKAMTGRFNPVAHFIEWHVSHASVSADDKVSMLSGLAHDPLLRDIFTPLYCGATLSIPAQADLLDPQRLWNWLAGEKISVAHMTPNLWQLLMQGEPQSTLASLRVVAFGGDRLTQPVVTSVNTLAPQARILNFYGATETPQAMACAVVTGELHGASIPLGRGIDGVQLLVVNAAGQLCHTGETGEIWIRTPYLVEGYLGGEETPRFIANPFSTAGNDRVYSTGDKGRYLPDGNVEFLGRLDQQVKIRGYRVEPAELQTRLLQHGQIAAAAVTAVEHAGETRLLAYVVPTAGTATDAIDTAGVRQHLRGSLPEYMMPVAIVGLEQLPLTPNGKLDRARLPDYHAALEGRTLIAPRNDTEAGVLEIWQQVLKNDSISMDDQFFDVGGHSLLATQVVARVRDKYAIEFSLKNIFEVSTVEGMARYVDTALWARQASSAPVAGDAADDDMEEIEI